MLVDGIENGSRCFVFLIFLGRRLEGGCEIELGEILVRFSSFLGLSVSFVKGTSWFIGFILV